MNSIGDKAAGPWLVNEKKIVLVQFLIWSGVGLAAVTGGWLGQFEDGLLWVMAATILLSYSTLSAGLGIFVPRWGRYVVICGTAYLLLAMILIVLLSQISHSPLEEFRAYSGMYMAFLFSFFMVHAVAVAVRKIAEFTQI